MRTLVIGLNLLVLSMVPIQVQANTALDTIKLRITQLFDVLRDPALQGEAAEELKKEKIWSIFDKTFDYTEFSKRTLSRTWNKLNPNQREEFTELYKALLDKVYMNRILAYTDQQIVFGKERALAQNRVEVRSKIVAGSNRTPIHFRMILKNDQWRVYDVVVEGISLVRNYRSQFKRIIRKESLEGMFAILRKKVSKLTSRLNQRGPGSLAGSS
ncbi:MAG: ABC transporter substrate-binding protein [Nitrospirota bacterium]|nr:ABC transporter substrate-binding protein [Nitrospirota bacterium]